MVEGSSTMPGELPRPGTSMGRREYTADAVMVFEFSAVTWNPHRVHYDADYAREQEGHPTALVQGPLQGALLEAFASAWAIKHEAVIGEFRYRHTSPVYVGANLTAMGTVEAIDRENDQISLALWIESSGRRTTTGTAVARRVSGGKGRNSAP